MRWHPWASVLLVASAKTRKPREVKPRPLATLPALPHCRDVEVIHVPKTGGTALIRSLARADVDVCYSETWRRDLPFPVAGFLLYCVVVPALPFAPSHHPPFALRYGVPYLRGCFHPRHILA